MLVTVGLISSRAMFRRECYNFGYGGTNNRSNWVELEKISALILSQYHIVKIVLFVTIVAATVFLLA